MDSTIAWFANPDWGLGLPYPTLMAYLATYTELVGAIFLLFGFATRWISIPLLITMLVAMSAVHWDNGWKAIAPDASEASQGLQQFLNWLQTHFPKRHAYLTEISMPALTKSARSAEGLELVSLPRL